jgi:zinc D-Ala-D-Ala carboxypeptidase
MRLSENLTLAEMTRSESAKRLGISNQPTPEHLHNMQLLAFCVFQPIRNHFKRPIHVSSGYRSQALNKAVGGSRTSQHSTGQAMDIDMDGTEISNKQIFDFIKDNLDFDQMIWEFGTADNPDWVHVSYSGKRNRKQILRATGSRTKPKYQTY